MFVRQMLAALVVTAVCAPAALAATTAPAAAPAPAARCSALEGQFDKAVATSVHQDKARARTLRTEGANLCNAGKTSEGIRKLEDAVKMIGGTPQ